ncbi:hypothetical protein Nepgr_017755 [Nepenthes gracilis]|uniref:BED-type domain-containing protein n=1 Tax=Nepenthes gracilis TaxID=150966 RepID=A0AAD3XTE9_NEPGR|nr:hypothetical protein Nepgr_017755 [Nepenthes gracilis]
MNALAEINGTQTLELVPNGTQTPESQPNKRRRKKSIVWEHFTIETVGAGCTRACCKQCKKSFAYITGSKLAGTSHLKRHIAMGICPVSRHNQEKNQLVTCNRASQNGAASDPRKKCQRRAPGVVNIPFDQERCNHEIARMIILHEYPLHMVEFLGFINFARAIQPQFNVVTFETAHSECVAIYMMEKQRLANLLAEIPGRINLSLDFWTSDQTTGYAILSGHFIDGDWMLHRRILNVVTVPFPESDVAFNHAVVSCLSHWGLESKLFTLTVDQSFASGVAIGNLKGLLSIKNSHMLNGQFLIGNCFSRFLSRLAQEAMEKMKGAVGKVREGVKYVKASVCREEKFSELKHILQVPSSKSLVFDNQMKWDSTFHMLSAACELKEVFSCFDTSDLDYKEFPSMDDWKHIETLCSYLKLFFDAANILALYPTADKFFHEVCKIRWELTHAAMSQDHFVSNLIKPLSEKFDKYWKDCSLVLAMSVVMDPRFKLKLMDLSFSKIYGKDAETWIRMVDEGIHELFLEYVAQTLPLPSIHVEQTHDSDFKMEPHDETLPHSGDGLLDFDVYISEISSNHHAKSELDQYLEESPLPRGLEDFDILEWWKLNKLKYPTLSKMAADILSIPFSTVASNCVFDNESLKLDSYRCSLRPNTLEALVCAKDWIQCGIRQGSSDLRTAIVEMET